MEDTHPRYAVLWPVIWLISTLEGSISLFRLFSIPPDPKNSFFLGYSASRLAIIAVLLAATLGSLVLAIWSARRTARVNRWLFKLADQKSWFLASLVLALAGFSLCWGIILAWNTDESGASQALLVRAAPLLTWGALFCLQFILAQIIQRFGLHAVNDPGLRGFLRTTGIFWILLLSTWALVAITGLGIIPDAIAWGTRGVPLLAWQIGLVWLVFLGSLAGMASSKAAPQSHFLPNFIFRHADLFLAAGLWLFSVLLWGSQPVGLSFFAPQVRPPNYEIYPHSDSALYDSTAQSILIGNGFLKDQILPRPLYILFIAALHAIGGQSYLQVIFLQSLALAFFPVMLYFLGKTVFNRPTGLLIAILASLREFNSIQATGFTYVSSSKLILSDLPTALVVALFSLAATKWYLSRRGRSLQAILTGGVMGITMLVRTQSVLLLPFIGLGALFTYPKSIKKWLRDGVLLVVCLALTVTPYLWRNWHNTGSFVFDQPGQMAMIAQRYTSGNVEIAPVREPGEGDASYNARMISNVMTFAGTQAGQVAQFVSAHFFNNLIDTLLVMPAGLRLDDYRDMLLVSTPFWHDISLQLTFPQVILIGFNLLMIALGMAAGWKKAGIASLIPLVINLAYNLSNSLARNSGWRYILPADWAGYFYFAAGLSVLATWILAILGLKAAHLSLPAQPEAEIEEISPVKRSAWQLLAPGLSVCLAFFAAGCLLPLSEVVVPARYQALTPGEIISNLPPQQALPGQPVLQQFLQQPGATAIQGRALYPRFYGRDQGETGNYWPAYRIRDYERLAFTVIGNSNVRYQVVLPYEHAPEYFPQASDVTVIGCQDGDILQAYGVLVEGSRSAVYLRPELNDWQCTSATTP